MTRLFATVLMASALLTAPAWAQSGSPKPSRQDQTFVNRFTAANMAEIDLGKMAQSKAADAEVKDFGRRMVEEHGQAGDQLKQLAQDHALKQPGRVDRKHRDTHNRLDKLSGAAFDRAYIDNQIQDHQAAAQILQKEIDQGSLAALKDFAGATLPTVNAHLDQARQISARIAGQTPQTSEMPDATQNQPRQ
ncbi:MAG: DUF4142 domain-containing protein [Magnetospirillum sp.]|nr:DUF4142 domain-containing protein [Magnetospirillum sp.]